MMNHAHKITVMQYIFLIHGVQLGVGILTLPRQLAEKSGTDGWMAIILSWLLSTSVSLVIIQIMKKHPEGTILDLITGYFGRWIGKAATVLFALYFAFLANVIFIREALFIQAWVLPYTGLYVLILLLSIPSYMIARRNISIIGRYSELVFFMTLWTVFVYLIPLRYGNWLHLLPVLKEGIMPVLSAVKMTSFSFIGFELAFFLYPFLQNKEKASMGIAIANTLSLLAYLIVTIGAFLFYSPDEILVYQEPTINIFKVIELKFIERLEIVFFSFYIFVISTTVLPYMFMTVFCTTRLLGTTNASRPLFWLLLINLAYVTVFPPTFDRNAFLAQVAELAGMAVAYGFPLCLGGYIWLHGRLSRRSLA